MKVELENTCSNSVPVDSNSIVCYSDSVRSQHRIVIKQRKHDEIPVVTQSPLGISSARECLIFQTFPVSDVIP